MMPVPVQRVKEALVKAKVVEDADVVTYVVVCDPGDEAVSALTQFARSDGNFRMAEWAGRLPSRRVAGGASAVHGTGAQ
jgi:hypothetical protein